AKVRLVRLLRVRLRLQRPLLGKLLDQSGLGDVRHVRWMTTRNARRQHGRCVVTGRLVVDGDVGVLLVERLDDVLERGLLTAGPDTVEADRTGDRAVGIAGATWCRHDRGNRR